MKLHNKNKVLMRANEGAPKPEKSIDIFRKIYYIILFLFLGYLIYYFIFKSLIVRGEGFIFFDVLNIESPVNGEVIDLNISKNIKKGQFLCNIKERIINSNPPKIINKVDTGYLKLLDLKAKYKGQYKEYLYLKKELNRLNSLKSLELFNPNETSYQNIKSKFNQLKINLDILRMQISEYTKLKQPKIKYLPRYSYINHSIYSYEKGEFIKGIEYNHSVVKVGDILFKIQTEKNLKIVGYFSQKHLDYLQKRDIISIMLPDGGEKDGYIKSVTFMTSNIKFTLAQKLKVIIIPIDKNITFWNKYKFLKIKLRKYKW